MIGVVRIQVTGYFYHRARDNAPLLDFVPKYNIRYIILLPFSVVSPFRILRILNTDSFLYLKLLLCVSYYARRPLYIVHIKI